jgi:hypothetical protein
MTNQMVSRFRVKKLSPKHPLPVYKEYQLPDLTDAANIQRAVPQIETGVEKEEEEEVSVTFIYLLGLCIIVIVVVMGALSSVCEFLRSQMIYNTKYTVVLTRMSDIKPICVLA